LTGLDLLNLVGEDG